jgi:hypothetical protein
MNDNEPGFGLAPIKTEGGRTPFDGAVKAGNVRPIPEHITLPSGNHFYANCLIVGIDPEGEIFQGYDGSVSIDTGLNREFTPQDRRDLAEMMIERWRKFGGLE